MIIWRIKDTAADMGISMTQLADLSGVSCGELYKIERGEKSPKFETVLKIAKALNVDIEQLYDEIP